MYGDHSYRMYHSLVNYVYSWNKAPQAVFFFIGTGIFVVPLLILLLWVTVIVCISLTDWLFLWNKLNQMTEFYLYFWTCPVNFHYEKPVYFQAMHFSTSEKKNISWFFVNCFSLNCRLLMYYYWVIGRGYATKEEFALEDLKMVNYE